MSTAEVYFFDFFYINKFHILKKKHRKNQKLSSVFTVFDLRVCFNPLMYCFFSGQLKLQSDLLLRTNQNYCTNVQKVLITSTVLAFQ